jgi:hypothetical protein
MESRRDFLRWASAGMATGFVVGATGCDRGGSSGGRPEAASGSASGGGPGGAPDGPLAPILSRPLLRPWASDMIWMSARSEELPVAYVSMELRSVFVDYDFRDRAASLLKAHISVSTAHWRIPLPGDPEGQPVMPGDERREFEELSMREWDPTRAPTIDDIRIVRGSRALRRVDFSCVPLAGSSEEFWLAAGPWNVSVAEPGDDDTTREDFMVVGTGLRYDARSCSSDSEGVQFVSWASRD